MNFDDLISIGKNSSRGIGNENFDLHHHAESKKFTVSEKLFAELDLENNGFTAHYNKNKEAFISIDTNDNSVSYKGRAGSNKGRAFTSGQMSKIFTEFGLEGRLALSKVGEKEGISFYQVTSLEEEKGTEEVTDTLDSEEVLTNESSTVEEELVNNSNQDTEHNYSETENAGIDF